MWILKFIPDVLIHILVLVSISALLILPIIKRFPIISKYGILLNYGFIALLAFCIYLEGALSNETTWKQKVAKLEVENAKLETKAAEVTTKIVTQTVEKIIKVKGNTVEIVKQIPVYITKQDDANCAIPVSFDQLHDIAAKNQVLDTSGIPNEGTGSTDMSGN